MKLRKVFEVNAETTVEAALDDIKTLLTSPVTGETASITVEFETDLLPVRGRPKKESDETAEETAARLEEEAAGE